MALQLVITNAGRAAVIDQGSGGFVAVRIAGVGVSATTVNATPEATSLPGEVKRIATIAGEATAGDVAHLTITDESSDSYTVRSFALYLSNGTLFAIYGQTEPIVQKSAQALLLLAVDVMLSNIPASVITFGNANFTNPAATTERAGVVELAADDEVAAGLDRVRAVTPRGLRQNYAQLRSADFTGLVTVKNQGGECFRAYGTGTSYAMYDAPGGGRLGYLMHDGLDLLVGNEAAGGIRFLFRGSAAATLSAGGAWNTVGTITRAGNVVWDIGNDGAGSGLDADLLDGQQGGWYADITARLGFTPVQQGTGIGQSAANVVKIGWSSGRLLATVDATNLGAIVFEKDMADVWRVGNDGAGSGLDADLLDGWHRDDIRLWTNLLGIPPLWTPGNDGAGSGLDADLLDGWHRDEIRDWGTILNKPGSFPAAAHTHGAADIAGAFTGSLSGNGYTVLPNGLILQWVTGAQQAAGFEGTQSVVFPIAFPNTCFQVIASTQVANPNTESHATYQLINYSNETATVMRQLVSSAGADREPSWPRLFAVGR